MLLNLGIRRFVSNVVIASIAVGTVIIIASTWSSGVDPETIEQEQVRKQDVTGKTLTAHDKQKENTSPTKKERSKGRSNSVITSHISQDESISKEFNPDLVHSNHIHSLISSDEMDASDDVRSSSLIPEKAFAIEILLDKTSENNDLSNESNKSDHEGLIIGKAPWNRRRNSISTISSDLRVSMWKIYHNCCCKINDLEQLLFENCPEKRSRNLFSSARLQKCPRSSLHIRNKSKRTIVSKKKVEIMPMRQDLEETCSTSIKKEGCEEARHTGLQRHKYHITHNKRLKKKKETIYSWQMLQYLSKKNSFVKRKKSSFLLRRHLSSKSKSPEEIDDDKVTIVENQQPKESSFTIYNIKNHVPNHSFSFSSVATTVEESEIEDEDYAERLPNNNEEVDDFRRMCIQKIYQTWKRRQLFKFVQTRIQLKRGFRALSQFSTPSKDHKAAIQIQAISRGYLARQDFSIQQREQLQVIRTAFLQVYQEHKFKILEEFCWKRLMAKRFFYNLKLVGYQRLLAGKRICMEIERWICQRKKYLELMKRREKRRQLLLNRKKKVHVKSNNPRTIALTDDLELIIELRRWVSQVMRQVHPDTKMIPPTAELMQCCPRLNSVIFLQRKSSRAQSDSESYIGFYEDQQVSEEFLQLFDHSSQQVCIIQKFLRCFVIGRRYKKAFELAKRRLNISTLLIQVAMKCRFAIMLLTAKLKYVHGLLSCQPLIRLGNHTRAAIIIQASWRYSRSSIQWKKYIRVCKLRLAMLASRSRKCTKEIDHGKYRDMVDYFRESWLQVEIRSSAARKLDVQTIRNILAVVVPPVEDPFSPLSFSPSCA
jgi:hypothetical protein